MEAMDIIRAAGSNIAILGPALLVISALSVADIMIDFVYRIVNRTAKEYKS